MKTNLELLFKEHRLKIEKLVESIDSKSTSYDFEKKFNSLHNELGHDVYQTLIGKVPKSKNQKITILTSMGKIDFPKTHPLATAPGGFKISPYLQEHLCRVGSKLTFDESSEELSKLLQLDVNAKQVERICHYYGDKLEQIDWKHAYNDGFQLRIPFKDKALEYVMMDGSMLLTRQKNEAWKEVKLCRLFEAKDRIEGISKNRNQLSQSKYVAHLGKAEDFLDKVLEILPTKSELVFICDGAKWIWKWIDEYFPNNTQILDFYHCKEHLYAFAKIYFAKDDLAAKQWVENGMEMLLNQQVRGFLNDLSKLSCRKKTEKSAKEKLLKYLQNNEKRINYGLFKEKGLLLGSGAIESAHRDIIQKRMKLSGQRWTVNGAQQMLNLRVAYKSGLEPQIRNLITDYQKVA